MRITGTWFGLLALYLCSAPLVLAAPARPATGAGSATAHSERPMSEEERQQEEMKNSVLAVESQLGELEPWQKEAFLEGVVPQYHRFVRFDPESQDTHTVDVEAVRQYLMFAGGEVFKGQKPTVLMYLKADRECGKCQRSVDGIREQLEKTAIRRGFTPVWVNPVEVGDSSMIWEELDARIHELARIRSAAAVWVVQMRRTPLDSIDTAHFREKLYQMRSFFLVRTLIEMKHQDSLHLSERESFGTTFTKLTGDAFLQFGNRMIASASQSLGTVEEIRLVMGPPGDYVRFNAIRKALRTSLHQFGPLYERSISRSGVVFALSAPEQKREEVRRVLASLQLENGQLSAIDAGEEGLKIDFLMNVDPEAPAADGSEEHL